MWKHEEINNTSVAWIGDKKHHILNWYRIHGCLFTSTGKLEPLDNVCESVILCYLPPEAKKLDILIIVWSLTVNWIYPAHGCGIFRIVHRSSLPSSKTFRGLELRLKSFLCSAFPALPRRHAHMHIFPCCIKTYKRWLLVADGSAVIAG